MIFAIDGKRHLMAEAVGQALKEPVFYVVATASIWSRWLEAVSEVAARLGPIFAILLAIARIWMILHERRDGEKGLDRAEKSAGLAGTAVTTAAKLGGKWLAPVLGALGAVALVAWLLTPSPAKAAPAARLVSTAAPRKRKTADDAGDEPVSDGERFSTDVPPPWFVRGRADLGQHERPGRKHNPVIVKYFADAGFPGVRDDETAWCAAFVNASLEREGIPGSKSLAARSFLNWGEECTPRLGCVVVIHRGDPKGWQGHVFFYAGETETHILGLGGNQGDSVSIAKFPKSKVLGYRWPRRPGQSRTARAAAASAALVTTSEGVDQIAPTPERASALLEAVEPVKGTLSQLGEFVPIAAKVALALGVALALYAAWRRLKDFKERGV